VCEAVRTLFDLSFIAVIMLVVLLAPIHDFVVIPVP
jgi:hypothetical protein